MAFVSASFLESSCGVGARLEMAVSATEGGRCTVFDVARETGTGAVAIAADGLLRGTG